MRLLFLCPTHVYRDAPFDGSSLERGMGGSESALVHLAEALVERGHRVVVAGAASREREVAGVSWVTEDAAYDADVLVLFRFADSSFTKRKAALRVLWTTDVPTDDFPYRLSWSLQRADAVVTLSPFHASAVLRFAKTANIDNKALKIAVLGCPIDDRSYTRITSKLRYRFIHCSVPDRGRDLLLRLWPVIRSQLPEATLVITGGYGLWGRAHLDAPPPSLDGVAFCGVVPRSKLVQEQLRAEVHLHPCPWPENFCIASAECQAAGAPSIVSAAGALPTTVLDRRTGLVVRGHPTSDAFQRRFAEQAVRLVKDRPLLRALASAARERALREFARTVVAAAWEEQLQIWMSSEHEGGGR